MIFLNVHANSGTGGAVAGATTRMERNKPIRDANKRQARKDGAVLRDANTRKKRPTALRNGATGRSDRKSVV